MILKSRVFLQGTLTARTIIAGILSKLSTNTIIGATISDDVKVTSLNIHGFELKKWDCTIHEGVHFSDVVDVLHPSTVVPSKADISVQKYFEDEARVTLNVKTGNIV